MITETKDGKRQYEKAWYQHNNWDDKRTSQKVPDWRSQGPDGLQGYWVKIIKTLNERIVRLMENIISNRKSIPKWITLGKMVICQKDLSKENAVDNYRPILCLPLMWKLMTGTIAAKIYNFLDVNDKLPVDKKDVGKKVEGPKINYELIRPYSIIKETYKSGDGMKWLWEALWYGSPFLNIGNPWTCASVWQHPLICIKINDKLANTFGESRQQETTFSGW